VYGVGGGVLVEEDRCRVCGCMGVGCMYVWVYGCMGVWVYGCMGVWVMGVWVYGGYGCMGE
jgi:hypothetical protein